MSEPPQRGEEFSDEQAAHPDGGFTERDLIENASDEASGCIIDAEHAAGTGAGIQQKDSGCPHKPEDIFGSDGKCRMAHDAAQHPEAVEQHS